MELKKPEASLKVRYLSDLVDETIWQGFSSENTSIFFTLRSISNLFSVVKKP
jgi:hypothetical protein